MHGCFWRTQLLVFVGYLQGTVQAFALQVYQALDLWESKILLSAVLFPKGPLQLTMSRVQNKAKWLMLCSLVKGAQTSFFHCTEKMLPQSCWLVSAATWGEGDGASASLQAVFPQWKKWLKAMNYWLDELSQEAHAGCVPLFMKN